MKIVARLRNRLAVLSLTVASLCALGCGAEQPQSQPGAAPTTAAPVAPSLKRIVEDVKPPVIVKPDVAPATGAAPVQPK